MMYVKYSIRTRPMWPTFQDVSLSEKACAQQWELCRPDDDDDEQGKTRYYAPIDYTLHISSTHANKDTQSTTRQASAQRSPNIATDVLGVILPPENIEISCFFGVKKTQIPKKNCCISLLEMTLTRIIVKCVKIPFGFDYFKRDNHEFFVVT